MKIKKLFRRSFANKLYSAKKVFIKTYEDLKSISNGIQQEMTENEDKINKIMDEQDMLASQLNVTKCQIEEISKFI